MRATALVLALSMSACSWAFMAKPPDPPPPPNVPVQCSTSKAAPVLDLIIAVPHGLLALLGLAILLESNNSGDEVGEAVGDVFGTVLLIEGAVVAVPYGLSARSGFKYADKCRELQLRQYQQYQQQWQPPQRGYPNR